MENTAAVIVAGLRQDLAKAWNGSLPCSVVAALVVNACFGGEILCYDLGLRGPHYLNRICEEDVAFYVDLTKDPVFADWIAPCEAVVCERAVLIENDDTFDQFTAVSGRLLAAWGNL